MICYVLEFIIKTGGTRNHSGKMVFAFTAPCSLITAH
jgi:hypothetical protein